MGNYHAQMLMNHVQRIPFEDHSPPLLLELIHFCRESTKWMKQDPKNVVAVHCKGGKGRTGVMIAALLVRESVWTLVLQYITLGTRISKLSRFSAVVRASQVRDGRYGALYIQAH